MLRYHKFPNTWSFWTPNWKDDVIKLHVLCASRYLNPTFQIVLTLSLHKSNLCPVRINLPHVQVFILSKTCIKLIWSKALCQTTLLCFLKSAVRTRLWARNTLLGRLTFTCIKLVSCFCCPKHFFQSACFGVVRFSELYNRIIKLQQHALASHSKPIILTTNQDYVTLTSLTHVFHTWHQLYVLVSRFNIGPLHYLRFFLLWLRFSDSARSPSRELYM